MPQMMSQFEQMMSQGGQMMHQGGQMMPYGQPMMPQGGQLGQAGPPWPPASGPNSRPASVYSRAPSMNMRDGRNVHYAASLVSNDGRPRPQKKKATGPSRNAVEVAAGRKPITGFGAKKKEQAKVNVPHSRARPAGRRPAAPSGVYSPSEQYYEGVGSGQGYMQDPNYAQTQSYEQQDYAGYDEGTGGYCPPEAY